MRPARNVGPTTSAVTATVTQSTLLQSEGASILVILAIPVVLTLIGLLAPLRFRQVAAIIGARLLAVGVLLGMLSIGVFFVPALVCCVVAPIRSRRALSATVA